MNSCYILDSNHNPIPCDENNIIELERFLEDISNRRVAEITVGNYWISTVFLVFNYNSSSFEEPLLFETRVQRLSDGEWLGPDGEEIQLRCSTWDKALKQHKEVEDYIREKLK